MVLFCWKKKKKEKAHHQLFSWNCQYMYQFKKVLQCVICARKVIFFRSSYGISYDRTSWSQNSLIWLKLTYLRLYKKSYITDPYYWSVWIKPRKIKIFFCLLILYYPRPIPTKKSKQEQKQNSLDLCKKFIWIMTLCNLDVFLRKKNICLKMSRWKKRDIFKVKI